MPISASMKRSFRRVKRPRSRACAFEVTTSVEACSVSMRKLPMSALRCLRSATRPSSRAR